MPVEGIPDPAHHRICRRCRKWFEPEEGVLLRPEVSGLFTAMQSLRASVIGSEADLRFQCHRCTKVRRTTFIILVSLLAALVALVLLLARLGILA